jgi:hypothetical protein
MCFSEPAAAVSAGVAPEQVTAVVLSPEQVMVSEAAPGPKLAQASTLAVAVTSAATVSPAALDSSVACLNAVATFSPARKVEVASASSTAEAFKGSPKQPVAADIIVSRCLAAASDGGGGTAATARAIALVGALAGVCSISTMGLGVTVGGASALWTTTCSPVWGVKGHTHWPVGDCTAAQQQDEPLAQEATISELQCTK